MAPLRLSLEASPVLTRSDNTIESSASVGCAVSVLMSDEEDEEEDREVREGERCRYISGIRVAAIVVVRVEVKMAVMRGGGCGVGARTRGRI
jgi:hypothetical protein